MKKLISLPGILLPMFILLSCKSNITDPDFINNDHLFDLAYSDMKLPDGFYKEDSLANSVYYENTISIKPLSERENKWVQLSTDNKDTARNWSELSSKNSAYFRTLISERETDKYFEFTRVYSANPKDIVLSRVHKYSYLDRSMYDLMNKSEVIGRFTKQNFTQDDVKEMIEYLWFVDDQNQIHGRVHRSDIERKEDKFIHTIYTVEVSFGDLGSPDIIRYIKNTFEIKTSDGEIKYNQEILKQIPGKRRNYSE